MVLVVMDIYLQIVHHNSVTRMMDISYQKVLLSTQESDLETLSGLKTKSFFQNNVVSKKHQKRQKYHEFFMFFDKIAPKVSNQ